MHKEVSKSMNMLTNLLSQVGKIKRYGNKTHTCFYLEKRKEDDVGKKQVDYTESRFSFSLKSESNKAAFQKKYICAL